jgi:signal transduction histidine kinase/ActR/RegA family two-component response regulator/putative methionine-R-sulfoxide reductase with GAF domain
MKENLLVQFSVIGFLFMVAFTVVVSAIMVATLNNRITIIDGHQWVSSVVLVGGFAALYGGLVTVVWRGWVIVARHRVLLESANRELTKIVEASAEEVAVIDEIAKLVTTTLEIAEVYERFALEIKRLISFDRASVNVVNQESGTYTLKHLVGQPRRGFPVGCELPLAGSETAQLIASGSTMIRHDLARDPQYSSDADYAEMGLRSSILVPLISAGKIIGSMGFRSNQRGLYGPREQAILERLAYQISPAVENARLYEETRIEKERATHALAQLRAVLNSVDTGICLTSQSATVLWLNQSFGEFFGVEGIEPLDGSSAGAELLNTSRYAYRHCLADPDAVFAQWRRIDANSQFVGYTGELEVNYPRHRTLEEFTAPVSGPEDKYIGRLWVYKDITERKRVEEQLLNSQKIESVGRLAGGVAHDFNNLLTVISGYAQLAVQALPEEGKAASHIREVQAASRRAANLVDQLLTFSRSQTIEPQIVDLNDLIINVHEMLRRLVREDIELITDLAAELEPVRVDPGQVDQVLMNLVANARDAMPRGGAIMIRTTNLDLNPKSPQWYVGALPGKYVMLSVEDTGIGMTEEVKAHIFEPFFTTKEIGQGTGLGLSTCYGIITQSDGHIEVYSSPGRGALFEIIWPVAHAELTNLPEDPASTDLVSGTETILIAEDESAVRVMVADILRSQGYQVLEASCASEALGLSKRLRGSRIDLLLTDLVMPNMNGYELAKRFRSQRPEVQVLYTSGYLPGDTPVHDTVEMDAEFLQKPYNPDVLVQKVREILDREAQSPTPQPAD